MSATKRVAGNSQLPKLTPKTEAAIQGPLAAKAEAAIQGLLDSQGVADYLGNIPARTIDSWAYRGIGPRYARIGKHRRYDLRDVDQWIESQKVRA